MVASLPALTTFMVGHTPSGTEWNQILNCSKALTNIKTANFWATMAASTAGLAWVDITGASLSGFVKQLASSDVLILMGMSSRVTTTANHNYYYAINDGTTDWTMVVGWMSRLNAHTPSLSFAKLTGLAAATYTFKARLHADGANTITIDNNDMGFIIAMEIPN